MNHVRVGVAFVIVLTLTSATVLSQRHRAAPNAKVKKAHNLRLYFGKIIQRSGSLGGTVLRKGDIVVPADNSNVAVIDSDTSSAMIVIAPGSQVTVGTFDDGGETVTFVNLDHGFLSYSDTSPLRGAGRKYIVRGRGRALGALGTEYELSVPRDSKLSARLEVTAGSVGVGWTTPGNYLKPDEVIKKGRFKEWY